MKSRGTRDGQRAQGSDSPKTAGILSVAHFCIVALLFRSCVASTSRPVAFCLGLTVPCRWLCGYSLRSKRVTEMQVTQHGMPLFLTGPHASQNVIEDPHGGHDAVKLETGVAGK